MNEQDVLIEQLGTVRNLVDTAVILINLNREELIPTILELLLIQCQELVDKNCVEGIENE